MGECDHREGRGWEVGLRWFVRRSKMKCMLRSKTAEGTERMCDKILNIVSRHHTRSAHTPALLPCGRTSPQVTAAPCTRNSRAMQPKLIRILAKKRKAHDDAEDTSRALVGQRNNQPITITNVPTYVRTYFLVDWSHLRCFLGRRR